MASLRVCHCIDDLSACGAQQVVKHLVTNLDKRKFEPFVYTFRDGPLRDPIERAGVTVRVLPRWIPKLDLPLVMRIRHALSQDIVNVLHMHLFGACLHGTLAASGLGGIRKIVTVHSDREDNLVQRLGWPLVFAAADAAVAVSCQSYQAMSQRYVSLVPKATIVFNGIDTATFGAALTKQSVRRRLRLPTDRPLVGTIGRLSSEKGHKVLLAAFAEVRAHVSEAELLLIGEGELEEALRRTSNELEVNEAVHFLGSRHDIPELLAAMDVFVLSSFQEGMPLVLLEAMAAGIPLVATTVGGIPEVISDREDGLLVPPADPHRLALAIQAVLGDPSLASRLAQNALTKVREHFSVQKMVREHELLYQRVS